MNKYQGVMLLEILIALAILSFAFLSLVALQTHIIVANDLAKQRSQAVVYAEDKLEEFRAYDGVSSGSGVLAYDDFSSGSDLLTGENASYQRSWAITENTSLNYKTVTVTVSWTNQDNVSHAVILSTIIGRNDPKQHGQILLAP